MTETVRTIAVIGAGQMGLGIAQVFAQAGYRVLLHDADPKQIERAVNGIRGSLKKFVAKGKFSSEAADTAIAAIQTTTDLAACAAADVAIEAVTEQFPIKQTVFQTLDRLLQPHALIASNTSSIAIGLLGATTRRPGQVIGMHFMNPVPLMPCVEVIRAAATTDPTFRVIQQLIERLGKTMVVSQDRPGFIVNRILAPMLNEAAYALQDGLATREDIDTAMTLSCNFPMGPLTLADFVGLDTLVAILEVMQEGLKDPKFRPCPLLKEYVAKGWVGKKSGKGFYDYR